MQRVLVWLGRCIMILIGSVVLINLYIIEYAQVRIVQHPNDLSSTQWGMILGASVYADGSLSPALQQRVDLALELYDAQLISSFFVSGSDQEHYKEVAAMVHYLTGSGVPLDHIETDPGGFDTYDSMWRAKELSEIDKMIVITQQYHLMRAVYIGRKLGIDVIGISPTPYPMRGIDYQIMREWLARVKAFVDVEILQSSPKRSE